MLSLLVLLSAALGSSAGALAPRASSVPLSYYTPAYFCPSWSIYRDYNNINNPSTSFLFCFDYLSNPQRTCYFSMNDGTLIPETDWGYSDASCSGLSAIPEQQQPCGLRCPSMSLTGVALERATEETNELDCLYSRWCYYNLDGTPRPGNGDDCPLTVIDSCVSNRRRRYRGEDNFTALLRKRSRIAAAKPVPS
ncbi:hypothetical protein C8R45DRAFT_1067882 [Mycena sanguinolenta]|nr:hypothetical protein C8R45DRAFT_1067882 [Mycena sanguinolenta]